MGDPQWVVSDLIAPFITTIAAPPGTYIQGDNIGIAITFSEEVTVTGNPTLELTAASGNLVAGYASGSGTNTLMFNYTVQPVDLDTDGIVANALLLSGSTIKDAAGNNADLTLNGALVGVNVEGSIVIPTIAIGGSTDNTSCGAPNGSIELTGLTANETYDLDYLQNGSPMTVLGVSADGFGSLFITDLIGDSYSDFMITISGFSSNVETTTVSILDNPDIPVIVNGNVVVTDASSVESFNGELDATSAVSGGVPTYTYQWYEGVDNLGTLLGSTSTLSNLLPGVYTLEVTDANGCIAAFETFTVNAANTPPTIAGQNPLSMNEDTDLTISFSDLMVNDPDNSYPIGFSLLVQSGSNYTFGGTTITPDLDFNGTLNVPVLVNDGTDNSSLFNLTITVNAVNDAPTLSAIGNKTLDELSTLSFTALGSDLDVPANTLTYSLDSPSSVLGMTINGTTGVFGWTPSESQDGVYSVIVSVSDGLLTASETISVTVNEVNNNTPLITSIGIQSIAENALFGALIVDLEATDVDSGTTFVWSLGTGNIDVDVDSNLPFAINSSTGEITVNDPDDLDFSSGTTSFALQVLVSDGANTDAITVSIDVLSADLESPTVTLSTTSPSPTNANTLAYTVAFSESVTGFVLGGLTVTNGTASNLVGSGSDYTFDVTPTGDGVVTVTVASAAGSDVSGNVSDASNTVSVTVDTAAPTVVLSTTASNPTNSTSIPYTATFSESVTGFALSSVAVTNGSASGLAGSGAGYTFNITPSNDGAVSVSIGAESGADAAGNTSSASNVVNLVVDVTAPSVTVIAKDSFSDRPSLSGTVSDNSATVIITVDGQNYPATVSGSTWSVSEETILSLLVGTYDVIATATDAAGNNGLDNTVNELNILPGTTITTAATSIDYFSFQANWSARSGVESYQLDIATDVSFNNLVEGYSGKSTSTTSELVTGLTYGTNYYYRVRVVYPTQDVSINSNVIMLRTLTDPATALDSTALISIYDAIGGAKAVDLNWKKGLPVHKWTHVAMTATRVTSVDLKGLDLTGTFPAITQGLEELKTLDLSNNKLTGVSNLTNLTNLTSLKLEGNKLGFASLEANISVSGLTYAPQDSVITKVSKLYEQRVDPYTLDRTVTGSANTYQWFKKDNAGVETPVSGSNPTISLNVTSFANEGFYYAEVTSSKVANLTLTTQPIQVKVSSLERDRLALMELYTATKGSQWTNSSGWNAATVSNSWFGVAVENSRVTKLALPSNGLDGNVPASLADIASLKTIDLSKNDLRSFPDVTSLTLTSLKLDENRLVFRDLIPNKAVSGLSYAKQKRFGLTVYDTIDAGTNYLLSIDDLGEGANYQWKFGELVPGKKFNDDVDTLSAAISREYTLENIDINSQGTYRVAVTHPDLPGLTIESRNKNIMAQTDFFGKVNLTNNGVKTGVSDAEVFVWRQIPTGPFVKEDSAKVNSSGDYILEDVVLGTFVVVAKPNRELEAYKYALQTYYISELTYSKANKLLLDGVTTGINIDLQTYTPEVDETGAVIEGYLFSDFPEDTLSEDGKRILARRKVRKAACSMRKFKSTGRDLQEVEDEIAYYIETDDEGYFNFEGVAEGRYLLNIEFPGVPMDPDAAVEFVIGGDKENQKFTVEAVVKETGITVDQSEVLFSWKPYIKDIKLYPNPTEGLLQFDYTVYRKLNDLKVQLVNTQGMILEEHPVEYRKAKHNTVFDLTEYGVGVYFLVFTDEAGSFSQHVKVGRK